MSNVLILLSLSIVNIVEYTEYRAKYSFVRKVKVRHLKPLGEKKKDLMYHAPLW